MAEAVEEGVAGVEEVDLGEIISSYYYIYMHAHVTAMIVGTQLYNVDNY